MQALLNLGSNAEPEANILEAIGRLQLLGRIVAVSPMYRVPAVGGGQPDFVNGGLLLDTRCPSPADLRDWLHAVEDALGRDRSAPALTPRTIDIDIVLTDAVSPDPDRPASPEALRTAAYVAVPSAAICPDWVDPVGGQTLLALAESLRGTTEMTPLPELDEAIADLLAGR